MSQSVLAVRTLLVMSDLPSGASASPIPCFAGSFPVAMVVQMTGDLTIGSSVRSGHDTPDAASLARFGSFPSARSFWVSAQSMLSMPTTMTRLSTEDAPRAHPRTRPASAANAAQAASATAAERSGRLTRRVALA